MRGMITSNCPKLGSTINSLAEEGLIKPVFVEIGGVTHKANSIISACDWLRQHGYYGHENKEMAKFTYVS